MVILLCCIESYTVIIENMSSALRFHSVWAYFIFFLIILPHFSEHIRLLYFLYFWLAWTDLRNMVTGKQWKPFAPQDKVRWLRSSWRTRIVQGNFLTLMTWSSCSASKLHDNSYSCSFYHFLWIHAYLAHICEVFLHSDHMHKEFLNPNSLGVLVHKLSIVQLLPAMRYSELSVHVESLIRL